MGESKLFDAILAHVSSGNPTERARAVEQMLVRALGRVSGEGVVVWTGREGTIRPTPRTGWICHVVWAVADQSVDLWFATEEAAMAHLSAIAVSEGRTVAEGARSVDLTAPGCVESYACVRRVK